MKNNLIVIAKTYSELPEKGEAIRVDDKGNVIAKFIDGNFDSLPNPNDNPTIPRAA